MAASDSCKKEVAALGLANMSTPELLKYVDRNVPVVKALAERLEEANKEVLKLQEKVTELEVQYEELINQ